MTSDIKLYQTPLVEGQNKLIDDIESFLDKSRGSSEIQDSFCSLIYQKSEIQLQKCGLDLEIKLSINQSNVPFSSANYCKITTTYNGVAQKFYYFVRNVEWTSESTIKLILRMDTLSTFGSEIIDTNNWNSRTFVEREHTDRYFTTRYDKEDEYENTYYVYKKKVNPISEGIDFPLVLKEKRTLRENLFPYQRFYLIYRSTFLYDEGETPSETEQMKNAVQCYLVAGAGDEIPVDDPVGSSADIDFNIDDLDENTELVFDMEDNPDLFVQRRASIDGVSHYFSTNLFFYTKNGNNLKGFVVLRKYKNNLNEDNLALYSCYFNEDGTIPRSGVAYNYNQGLIADTRNDKSKEAGLSQYGYVSGQGKFNYELVGEGRSIAFTNVRKAYKIPYVNSDPRYISSDIAHWTTYKTNKTNLPFSWSVVNYSSAGIHTMRTIDEIDRTDSQLIKIIELPYAPNTIVGNATIGYSFGANWQIVQVDETAEIRDKYERSFKLVGEGIEHDFSHFLTDSFKIDLTESFDRASIEFYRTPEWQNESKLLHSDFTIHKLVYDSFSIPFKIEKYADVHYTNEVDEEKYIVYYAVSSNITSGFVFKITNTSEPVEDICADFIGYESEEDYPLTLVCTRNNEVNIYNSAFLNYIRGGYNYDVKAKSYTMQSAQLSLQQSIGNDIFSILKGGTSSQGIVSGVIGLAQAFYNYKIGEQQLNIQGKQLQNSIDKSLKSLSLQSVNVSGSDNLSLFNRYAPNKVQEITYELRDIDKQKIAKHFHLFGYATNRNKLPDLSSRCFFNYVKCQAVFKRDLLKLIDRTQLPSHQYLYKSGSNSKIMDDIISKFNEGVFIVHKFNEGTTESPSYFWNIELNLENWEKFLEYLKNE